MPVQPLHRCKTLEMFSAQLSTTATFFRHPTTLPSPYSRYSRHQKQNPYFKLNRQIKIPSYDPTTAAEFVGHALRSSHTPCAVSLANAGNLFSGVTTGTVCPCATSITRHLPPPTL